MRIKRCLDIVISLSVLAALTPLLGGVALLVRLYMGRPVLFRQPRPGLHGELFDVLKFRTMTDARDESGQLLPASQRMTPLGKALRRTSLDELPQLWNVLKGDMSLVGPRPLLVEYLNKYTPEQFRRHEMRPGITGLAQVNGRNAIGWEEKFAYDVWYVDNWSIWLDFKILFKTVRNVLLSEGISHSPHETMPTFLGERRNKP